MDLRPLLLLLLLSLLVAPAAGQSPDLHSGEEGEVEPLPAARQNPVLRRHFREMYPRFRGERNLPNDDFIENFVDLQIDRFLKQVETGLEELKGAIEQAGRWRRELSSDNPQKEMRGLIRMRAALRETEELADGLADSLSIVFRQLDRKRNLPLTVRSDAAGDQFEEEFHFLKKQVIEAERLIRDYLFQTTNLVKLTDLKNEDMLVRLHWTEHMAKQIREELR